MLKPKLSIVGVGLIVIGVIFFLQISKRPISVTSQVSASPAPVGSPIRSEDQMWGEPAKQMFPDLVNPKYLSKDKATLADMDVVYFYKTSESLYVYPAAILSFHHIVNDVIDGEPVAVTLCLLSNSGVVYSRKVGGKVLTFGVLGPLYYGNLVMYDKQSDSDWIQLTGESFKGTYQGQELSSLGLLQKTTWSKIKSSQNIKVVTGPKEKSFYDHFYSHFYAKFDNATLFYAKFDDSPVGVQALKSKKEVDSKLPELTPGIGIILGEQPVFYRLSSIQDRNLIEDQIGGIKLKIIGDPKNDSIQVFSVAADGFALEPLNTVSVYWFTWSAFYPQTKIYTRQ